MLLLPLLVAVAWPLANAMPRQQTLLLKFGRRGPQVGAVVVSLTQDDEELIRSQIHFPDGAPGTFNYTQRLPNGSYHLELSLQPRQLTASNSPLTLRRRVVLEGRAVSVPLEHLGRKSPGSRSNR